MKGNLKNHINSLCVKLRHSKQGQGMLEVILVAAIGIIVTGLIFAPQIQTFFKSIMSDATNWYETVMKTKIFPTS
jgi:fructose-specific phosphotransferase system IIC component